MFFALLQKLMPGEVVSMVANVSRITGACQLLQADTAAQVHHHSSGSRPAALCYVSM